MIGSRVTYTTPAGLRVQALCTEVRADLPVFDIEIIDADGEVVEHREALGHSGLTWLAQQRRWKEVAS